jgi:hypothetical protein
METYKLKMKIGDAEFDAEGPVEVVQAQFAAFKELIEKTPQKASERLGNNESTVAGTPALERIMKHDGRIVSLTAHTAAIEDAVMLVLIGQKAFRNNDSITGGEVIDGLRQSGHPIPRVDRVLDKLANDGVVIRTGEGRGTRYRLSNQGMHRGMELAKGIIATLNQ